MKCEERSIEWWNDLEKETIVYCEAEEGDIVCEVSSNNIKLAFLCQRYNEFNNIVCFKLHKENSIMSIYLMYYFMYILSYKYDIDYVRINGRYKFLQQYYPYALSEDGETWYCHLKKLDGPLYKIIRRAYLYEQHGKEDIKECN